MVGKMHERKSRQALRGGRVAKAFKKLVDSFRRTGWSGWSDEFLESMPQTPAEAMRMRRQLREGSLRGVTVLGGNGRPADVSGVARHLMRQRGNSSAFLPSKSELLKRLKPDLFFYGASKFLEKVMSKHTGISKREICIDTKPAQAFCLPLMLYASDTAYMCEFFRRMKSLSTLRSSTLRALRKHLGPYAGIAAGLAESCRLFRDEKIRRGDAASSMLRYFLDERAIATQASGSGKGFGACLPPNSLAARGLWVSPAFDETALPEVLQHYNFSSFSLTVDGAVDVLNVYKNLVSRRNSKPLLFLSQRSTILGLGFPTQKFYSPGKTDDYAPHRESELVLPPFAFFEPVRTNPAIVPMPQVSSPRLAETLALAWQVPINIVQRQLRDLFNLLSAGGHPSCTAEVNMGGETCGGELRPCSQRRGCQVRGCDCTPYKCVGCFALHCWHEVWEGRTLSELDFRNGVVVFIKSIHAEWP